MKRINSSVFSELPSDPICPVLKGNNPQPARSLSDLIKTVRDEIEDSVVDLSDAVKKLKDGITNKLKELDDEDNLRIFDGDNGGVIRGSRKRPRKCENKETGNVLCSEKNLIDGKLEVPYFRAVFNLPSRKFMLEGKSESTVRLLGYESVLMRKENDRKNKDISPRTLSCDLVGLTSDNRVLCIEGKVNPNLRETDIVYGLLASFAYGVCVEYFLSDKNRRALFINEVRACVNEFHAADKSFDENELTASFSLAAPREYFEAYFNPIHPMTEGKAKKRLCEAKRLLAALQGNGPTWAGFLIMNSPCSRSSFDERNRRAIKDQCFVEPHFKSGSLGVELAGDLKALAQRCKA